MVVANSSLVKTHQTGIKMQFKKSLISSINIALSLSSFAKMAAYQLDVELKVSILSLLTLKIYSVFKII